MTRIEIFDISDWLDAIEALAVLHRDEAEAELTELPVSLWRDGYAAMQDMGALVCVGAFVGEVMVGYATAIVSQHLHYPMVVGNHDLLFVHRDYRAPRLALRMVEMVEEVCKDKGAVMMTWSAKPGSAFERLMGSRARREEIVYIKEL